jgi:hypothetical protein
VDQRQGESDGQPGESFGCSIVGGAQDDEQKYARQDAVPLIPF